MTRLNVYWMNRFCSFTGFQSIHSLSERVINFALNKLKIDLPSNWYLKLCSKYYRRITSLEHWLKFESHVIQRWDWRTITHALTGINVSLFYHYFLKTWYHMNYQVFQSYSSFLIKNFPSRIFCKNRIDSLCDKVFHHLINFLFASDTK